MFAKSVEVNSTLNIDWGLGFGIANNSDTNKKVIFHHGRMGGSRALFVISPAREKGVVFFANSANAFKILEQIIEVGVGKQEAIISWVTSG